MRNSKGLVKIHVANITTAGSRVGQTNLCVEVGTVEVNLTAVVVDDIASVLDTRLKHSESRGIGDLVGGLA